MPTTAAKAEMFASQTGETYLALIDITSAAMSETLHFVDNTQNIASNGNTYIACRFKFQVPNAKVGNTSKASFSIQNIDRRAVEVVRTVPSKSPLTITYRVIRVSAPDIAESGPITLTLRDVEWTDTSLSGTLYDDVDGGMAIPKHTFNPSDFPGLYGSLAS